MTCILLLRTWSKVPQSCDAAWSKPLARRSDVSGIGQDSFSAGTTSFPGSDGSGAAELQRGLTSHPPELFRLISGPRRSQAAHQQSHTLCTSLFWPQITLLRRCLGEDSSTVNLVEGMQSQLIQRAEWATQSLQGHVLDILASKASLGRPTQAENPHPPGDDPAHPDPRSDEVAAFLPGSGVP